MPNLKAEQLLEAVKDRIPFRDLKDVMRAREQASTAGGWAQLSEEVKQAGAADLSKLITVLQDAYVDAMVAGTKEVFIFCLDDIEVAQIEGALGTLTPSASMYASAFPLPLKANQLASQTTDHTLTSVDRKQNGDVALIFCAKRSMSDRTPFKMSEVHATVQQAFNGFDGFIAIRNRDYQIFDVINFRKSLKRIEILIDHPERAKDDDSANERCLQLLGRISTYSPALNALYINNDPTNLFDCISSIYKNANEGRIQKMTFRAPSKSMKKETVQKDDDLRKEDYHEAGVNKVGAITPHDITIFWPTLPTKGTGSARIFTPLGSLSSAGTVVRSATLIEITDDSTLITIVNKLVSYS